MTDVAVIRPGCTDYDQQHRIAGKLELPMNAVGQAQAAELTDTVRELHLSFLLYGGGGNAEATAEHLADRLDLPVKARDALCNQDQGLWEGLTVADVKKRYPKLEKTWRDDPETVCPPDGESVGEALGRVRDALAKPLKKGKPFGVVAADPLATLVECAVTGQRPEFEGPLGHPRRCGSVTVVSTEGEVREQAGVRGMSSEEVQTLSQSDMPAITPAAGPGEATR